MDPEETITESAEPSPRAPDAHDNAVASAKRPGTPADSSIGAGRNEKSVLDIIRADASKHKKELSVAAAILIVASMFLFTSFIKTSVVMIAFIGAGSVSRMWQRFIPVSFGVELVMLFTVISGMLFGPFQGLLVGFLSLSISTFVTQEDIAKMWPSFIAIAIIGYLAGTLTISNIAFAGLMFTVLYDVLISAFYIATGHSIIKTLIFDATHIAFNYFVFYHVAPWLVGALA